MTVTPHVVCCCMMVTPHVMCRCMTHTSCRVSLYDSHTSCRVSLYDGHTSCRVSLYDGHTSCRVSLYDGHTPCLVLLYNSHTCIMAYTSLMSFYDGYTLSSSVLDFNLLEAYIGELPHTARRPRYEVAFSDLLQAHIGVLRVLQCGISLDDTIRAQLTQEVPALKHCAQLLAISYQGNLEGV